MEKKALGKGLEALLPSIGSDENILENQYVILIEVDHILPNRYQPRQDFPEDELNRLSESVTRTGLLQPVVVRRKGDGFYELVAGERRWRAAKMAGLARIPAMVRNCSDDQAMICTVIENVQRQDLNPMETAQAYHRMLTDFGMTQDYVAQQVGRDRSSVANMARLIQLPADIQRLVQSGQISAGHAKVLLAIENTAEQLRLAHRIVEGQLSVRQTEKLVEQEFGTKKSGTAKVQRRAYPELEDRLQKRLGTKVIIQKSRRGGRIVVHYFSQPELERILDALLA